MSNVTPGDLSGGPAAVEPDVVLVTPGAGAPVTWATPPPLTRWQRLQVFRQQHALLETGLFFTLGFLFDIFTLGRIDDVVTLVQQAAYLVLLGTLLVLDLRYQYVVPPPEPATRWGKVWGFSEDAVHFLFGSLLSTFTLFFFKSASGITSLLFLVAMFGLLVANELPRFRKLGHFVRLGLFAFCVTAYFAYVTPVLAGFLSPWLFVVSVAVASVPLGFLYRAIRRWSGDLRATLRQAALPMAGVQVALLGLYFLGAIPPVPLSVQHMGIYHQVEKAGGEYRLSHERPDWRFWHKGDQDFYARPGDKIYVFARIFAPRRFKDRVYVRFSYDDPKLGWMRTDRIPMTITGGREEGFRGYASKGNYAPGDWRVFVETEDGRTVGTLRFTVLPDPSSEPRNFKVELG